MLNQACMVCRQKNNSQYVDRLKSIERLVNKYESCYDNRLIIDLEDSIDLELRRHTKCNYGISNCKYLMDQYRKGKMIAEKVSKKIPSLINSGNTYEISELLNICRGYFPMTYRIIESHLS